MKNIFVITWQKVPERISCHAATEKEARYIAGEYISAMMNVEEMARCLDADLVLPLADS